MDERYSDRTDKCISRGGSVDYFSWNSLRVEHVQVGNAIRSDGSGSCYSAQGTKRDDDRASVVIEPLAHSVCESNDSIYV